MKKSLGQLCLFLSLFVFTTTMLQAQCGPGENLYVYCYENGEVNTTAFEICPSAGNTATATILQGVFEDGIDNLTVFQGASGTGSGTGAVAIYGPVSGDVGIGMPTINASVADECLIFIVNSDNITLSCDDGGLGELQVCGNGATPNTSFMAPVDLCVDAGVQTNLSGGVPTGGVYSGPGVTDDGNGMTYSFDPAAAGVGTQTIVYTANGQAADDDVEVLANGTSSFVAPADLCIDAGRLDNQTGGSPAGGTYSGPGVTDNGDGTYDFNPAVAGLGVHTITYTSPLGCFGDAMDDIEVLAACGCPAGTTTYFNCYGDNETDLVIFEVCPSAGQFVRVTIDQGTYDVFEDNLTIYQGATGSGTAGIAVFGPQGGDLAGVVVSATAADECLIFVNNSGSSISCMAGDEMPLVVCAEDFNGVTFTALPDLSVNAGIQTGLSEGSPTGGVYSGPGVTDDGNGMTYTFNPAVAGVGVHTLTYTVGGESASDDVEVLNILPPSFSKSFNPNTIGEGAVTTLTFTIDNTGSATGLTDLNFVDNLPAGMTVAAVPAITSTCGINEANITAVAGSSSITMTNGEVAANEFCTISVNVTTSTVGTSTNTTGDLTSFAGNSGTASANLTVNAACPLFSKSFSPGTINVGETSTLTFTIDNSGGGVDLNSAQFMDNLPPGLVVANPANITVTCMNGSVTAVPGSNNITYGPIVFGQTTVAAGTSCTISVDVEAISAGTQNNVTENFSILNNFFQTLNCGAAAAILEVVEPNEILLQKRFVTNPVSPGGTTELEFTITNLSRDFTATNVSFTDDLSAVLAGLTATGTPLNDICGTGAQLSGTTLLTFTGGTLAPNSSCTFSIPVMVPAGATSGTYPNTTSAITADIDGSVVTGNQANANLFVQYVPTFTKNFLNDPIPAGGTTTLEFTITNTSPTDALTDIAFNDNISQFISGTTISALPAANSCGAGSFFFEQNISGQSNFSMIGGNIAAGASCTFSIDLSIPSNVPSGSYTNTTAVLTGSLNGTTVQASPATDDLEVLAIPRLAKAFTDDPVNAGDIVNLEFTLTYDEFATGNATAVSFTDDLNAVIAGMSAIGLPMNDVCGVGSQISGTTNLSFTGGDMAPGEECTFTVPVQVPAGTTPGTYTNTTSALSATVGGQAATGEAATDDLLVGGFTLTKEFIPSTALPGELVTLRFTIDNTTAFDGTNIIFTDNLNAVIPGLTTEGALPTGAAACNASTVSGTTFFIYAGGSVSAGTSCSFDIPVRIPLTAANDDYVNTTSNVTVNIDGATRVLPAATAPLTVDNNRIQLTKTFTDDPVAPGGTVTVEYTITNLSATEPITNIAFTDDFDATLTGLAATGLPMSTCGGTLSGTGLLSFTGGSLAAGASCTFSVTLQVPANAPYGSVYPSPTSTVTGDLNGLAVVGDPATDDLTIESIIFTKTFSGPIAPGGTTTLTFTITNANPTETASSISFIDDLDAVVSGLIATDLPQSGICGDISAAMGSSVINFGRGELAPGASCSFDVTVMVPCGTAAGTYNNVTSVLTFDQNGTTGEAPPATDDLVVTASASVAFTAPADLCIDAGVQAGLGSGTPTGGAYSGPGVTDNGNDTYDFDPAAAGVGTHTITYTTTDGNGCMASASDDVEVFALPVVTFTAPADLCIDAGVQAGLGGGTPPQGTVDGDSGVYSGPGVTDDGNGMTYSFDPAAAGVGVHTITYTYTDDNGCSVSASDMIEVFALPVVMFTVSADLCVDAGVQAGLGGGTPMGGVYSGTGVTDDGNGMTYSFDPAAAGVGTHTLTYTVGASGCFDSSSDDVEVFALPVVTYSTSALENYSGGGFCVDADGYLDLQAGLPVGGVYSGPGVFDTGEGDEYLFTPSDAGVGVHTITYTYTDANGCTSSASDDIEVFALPTVNFTALADLCVDAGVQAGLGGGTPPQGTVTGDLGVYSGPGVTDDG
ncbi:MAG: beta strand repeat-containing protein, partial [Lewinella sp.]|uniref:beta strand repeat-containing protein n=1 Tax=Lewinella sp. TaxID=2004506 RepID=UPI003D6A08BC